MKRSDALLVGWIGLFLAVPGFSAVSPPRVPGGADAPGLLAVVHGEALAPETVHRAVIENTEQERFERLFHVGKYNFVLFAATLQERERWIEDRLLALAAEREGLSVEDYLRREAGGASAEAQASARSQLLARLRQAAGDSVHVPAFRVPLDVRDAPALGNPASAVTIVSFVDFFCGQCKAMEPALLALLEKFPGKVQLVAKHFALSPSDGQSFRFVEAALCAHEQGKYWEFRRELFAGRLHEDDLEGESFRFAARLGMDTGRYLTCLEARLLVDRVRNEQEEGAAIGVFGTPVVFVNGRRVPNAQDSALVERMIRLELAGAGQGHEQAGDHRLPGPESAEYPW